MICRTIFSFGGMCLFAMLTTLGRKPGLPICPSPLQSPVNYLFYPARLTQIGQHDRKRCFISAAIFLGFAGLDILLVNARAI
jgi:hypothetical protein